MQHPRNRQQQVLLGDGLDQKVIDPQRPRPTLGPLILMTGQEDKGHPLHLGILHQLLAQPKAIDPLHLDIGEHQRGGLLSERQQGGMGVGITFNPVVLMEIGGEQGTHHLVIVDHRDHRQLVDRALLAKGHAIAITVAREVHFGKQLVHQRQPVSPLLQLIG